MGAFFSRENDALRRYNDEIEYRRDNPEDAVRKAMDRPDLDGFKWKVWWVAASGFFTTSYSIFAANVITPALNYVYPECRYGSSISLIMNLTTLCGTMLGMIVFGVLTDRYGRKSIYGLELTLVVVATIGMTTASTGANNAMNIYGWIGFWRCLLGIGLGAEYPLSAVISAEWSSTRSRGTMMAAVFLMQSLGQLAAYGFGLAILTGIGRYYGDAKHDTERNDAMIQMIDIVWRITIGIGAVPALVSLFLRRMIPETPLFLAAQGHVDDAAEAAGQIYPHRTIWPAENMVETHHAAEDRVYDATPRRKKERQGLVSSLLTYLKEAAEYLGKQGRWRALLGVMSTWWLLDLAYYGIGLDNPKTISIIWLSVRPKDSYITNPANNSDCIANPTWRVDPSQPNITIYDMLYQEGTRGIATITSGTLTGSAIILLAINHVPRTTWMGWMFVALAALFAINGGTFFVSFETDKHALTLTLYVLAQVLFNLGPNTMTFILPAELFGTKYRATFYGLAAASGKLGAIVIQLILNLKIFKEAMSVTDDFEAKFAGLLLGLVPAMLLGAFITWVWIPEVQYPRGHAIDVPNEHATTDSREENASKASFRDLLKLPNKPLEEIDRAPGEGQNLGMRRSVARFFHVRSNGSKNENTQPLMMEVESGETDQGVILQQRRGNSAESDLADGPDSH